MIVQEMMRNVARRPGGVIATMVAVTASVFILVAVWVAESNVDHAFGSTGDEIDLVLFLAVDVDDQAAAALAGRIESIETVAAARYINRDAVRERIAASIGPSGIEGVDRSLMPASIEVSFAVGEVGGGALEPLVRRLSTLPEVESLELLNQWKHRVLAVRGALRMALFGLWALVAVVCAYTVFMHMRSHARQSTRRVSVLDALGAPSAWYRVPALIEGALYGACGAGLAVVIAWWFFGGRVGAVNRWMGDLFGASDMIFLSAAQVLAIVGGSAGIGLVGSAWAFRRVA